MSNEENLKLQSEEIEVLASIFGSNWEFVDDKVYNVTISTKDDQNQTIIQLVFSEGYPLNTRLIFRLNAPWVKRETKQMLLNLLDELINENIGQSIAFMCIEKIKEFLYENNFENTVDNFYELNEEDYENSLKTNTLIENSNIEQESDDDEILSEIFHGEAICDRKSTFQGHLAPIKNRKQVTKVLNKLLENKKIANATHNIYAYRIVVTGKDNIENVISNCEDGGEKSAGSRMLFLMKTLNVKNVMVVVSRWYGGTQLGADRFKHINDCCRQILNQHGYIDSKQKLETKKRNNKKISH